MEDIKFNHTLPIQLRFNDVDKFGHVNNTVYFSFYDLGKTEYFASVCPHVDWQKDGIVVVHIEANFLAQIYGSDHIAVQTAVTQIGTKSFHLAQRVIDIETQEVKCICTSVMVAYDLSKHESKPLTEEWIEAICKYEGRDLRKKYRNTAPYRIKFKSLAEYYSTVTSTGAWSDKKASPSVSASMPYFRTLSPLRTNT